MYYRNFIGLWLLGLINNFSYVVVNSAAQSLAKGFGKENLIGLILWANIALGLAARAVNTVFLEGISDRLRVAVAAFGNALGLILVAIAVKSDSWWFCLLGVILIGTASSFGESVILAHMRKYPSEMVTGWSSGTGMAGVAGSLVYLLLVLIGLDNVAIFLLLAPLAIVYTFIFFWMLVPVAMTKHAESQSHVQSDPSAPVYDAYANPYSPATPLVQPVRERATIRYKRCLNLVWWYATNLMLVYFFEYVASVGGSDKAQPADAHLSSSWFVREAYVILSFCYQLGVFISRSSLMLVKIRKVEVLTVLQGINMVIWLLQAKFKYLQGPVQVWILFAMMIYVGLLGGASYVNVYYLILNTDKIRAADRELCVNIAAIFTSIGITLSSVFILIMDNTFLK